MLPISVERTGRGILQWIALVLTVLFAAGSAVAVVDERIIDLPGFPVESHIGSSTMPWHSFADTQAFGSTSGGLTEGLRRLPGIVVQSGFGEVDPPRISVRGSGLQSAPVSRGLWIEVDGYPINSADGSFNLSLVESMWLEAAHLSPGGWSGTPAMGGRLDLEHGFGGPDPVSSLRFGLGSYGWRVLGVRETFALEQATVSVAAAHTGLDGWRSHSAQRRQSALAIIDVPGLVGANDLQLRTYAVRSFFDVPGPLNLAQIADNPRDNSARVQQDRPRRESEHIQFAARLNSTPSTVQWTAQAGIAYSDDYFRQLLPNGISMQSGLDSNLRLTLLHEWTNVDNAVSEWELHLQTADLQAWRYRNAAGEPGPLIGDNRLRADTHWLSWNQHLSLSDDISINASLTAVRASRVVKERFSGRPSTALSLRQDHLNPRFALAWQPINRVDFWAARSRVFEPPVFNDLIYTTGPMPSRELASRELDRQRADTLEFGISFSGDRLQADLQLHSADWRNELLNLVDETGAVRGTVNADKTRHRGFQAKVHSRLIEYEALQVDLVVVYLYNEAYFRADPAFSGNRIAGQPRHQLNLRLPLQLGDRWFVEPGVHWRSGRTYVDHANTLSYGSLIDFELGIVYSSGERWRWRLHVQNLLDRNQIASPAGVLDRAVMAADTAVFLPAAPIQLRLQGQYNW